MVAPLVERTRDELRRKRLEHSRRDREFHEEGSVAAAAVAKRSRAADHTKGERHVRKRSLLFLPPFPGVDRIC